MGEVGSSHTIFRIGDLFFEYDDDKNQKNIEKHGISFKVAARVFFDYDRIEYLMRITANLKTDLIQSEIYLLEVQICLVNMIV